MLRIGCYCEQISMRLLSDTFRETTASQTDKSSCAYWKDANAGLGFLLAGSLVV